jgi:DNA-binding GntR family transcriptional regulator
MPIAENDVPTISAVSADALARRGPIAGQLYHHIRRAILSLQFEPGEALSEKDLSGQFGVSRTPVREALIKLSEEGLVDVLPQRGSFVAPIRVAEVAEAQFIREALETAVIRRVAAHTSAALVAELARILERQHAAVERHEFDVFLTLDEAFHRSFCDFCDLPRAWKVLQNVRGQLDRVRYLSLPEPGHLEMLLRQHEAIAEGIRLRSPDLAAAQLKLHLQEVFGSVDLLMRSHPALFDGDNRAA